MNSPNWTDDLADEWLAFSEQLAVAEDRYTLLGVVYHNIPLESREEQLISAVRIELEEEFHIQVGGSGRIDHIPPIISRIAHMRELRVTGKRQMDHGEWNKASRTIKIACNVLSETNLQLRSIEQCLRTYPTSDIRYPTLAHLAMIEQSLMCAWILQLPDIKRGFELGLIENEDQAYQTVMGGDSDRLWSSIID